MDRITISVRIDDEIWKKAKIYAIEKGLKFGELIEVSLIHEMQKNGN